MIELAGWNCRRAKYSKDRSRAQEGGQSLMSIARVHLHWLAGALALLMAMPTDRVLAQSDTEALSVEVAPQSHESSEPSAVAAPAEGVAAAKDDIVAEVLVSGEQPGPGLWRVVKDDHELWILGTHGPLPRKMTWRSKQVEDAISQSQELLTQGGVDVKPNIGLIRGLFLLPAVYGAAKNPDGAKLADLLPSEVYAQWAEVKKKYLGRDEGIERWRPTFAILQLRSKARAKSGFGDSGLVWDEVRKLARKHRVKIVSTEFQQELRIEEPRKKLKQFAKVSFDDVDCFSKSVATVESDLETMRLRANAWATGDLTALRALPERDRMLDCAMILGEALLSGEISPDAESTGMLKKMQTEMMQAQVNADEKWLSMAKAALAKNESTFAVLPIAKLLKAEGPLDHLRADGYVIEAPIE
jgi:hypothetical protein